MNKLLDRPKLIQTLFDIMHKYDGFIVDLWGVIHDGYSPIIGVLDCLESLKANGKNVIMLSNAPRRKRYVVEQLTKIGVAPHLYNDVHTSGEDAYMHLKDNPEGPYKEWGNNCYALSSPYHDHMIKEIDLNVVEDVEQAAFLFNTGPEGTSVNGFDPVLRKASSKDIPMICVNPDISVIDGGKIKLCAGSYAKRYQDLGGEVRYHGKPYQAVYETVFEKFAGIEKSKILAIGDSLYTDILGANSFGVDSALVMSGIEGNSMGVAAGKLPELNKLLKLCQEKKAMPTYVLPRFNS